MAATASPDDELIRARDLGVDTCGRIAEFWGFTRTMGRAFGLLYLSRDPLPQAEIQRRLDISAGSASMTLAALGRWGVVHRIWVRGERREHYQAETDFWKMISGVLNERERREIAAAIGVVERARAGAKAAQATARGQAKAEADFMAERLQRLDDICRLGQTMLDMLLGQLHLDVGKFRDVLRVPPPAPPDERSAGSGVLPVAEAAESGSPPVPGRTPAPEGDGAEVRSRGGTRSAPKRRVGARAKAANQNRRQ